MCTRCFRDHLTNLNFPLCFSRTKDSYYLPVPISPALPYSLLVEERSSLERGCSLFPCGCLLGKLPQMCSALRLSPGGIHMNGVTGSMPTTCRLGIQGKTAVC